MTSPRAVILRWLPWFLILVGIFAFWKWQTLAQPVSYITSEVTRGTLEDAVTASGSLGASEYVDIGAQVSGVLQKLCVKLGQNVHKGDLLALIDPTVFEARVAEDEATLDNLEAQMGASDAALKLADLRLKRNQNLLKSDAVSIDELNRSEAEFSRAKSSIEALKADIDKAKNSIKASRANLGYTKIYSPMDGTVVQVQAREGQTLNASQTAPILFRLANLHTMTVEAQVSEADIQRIHPGMSVYFTTLGDPDTRHESTVRGVEPTPATTNPPIFYNTLFDVTNENLKLMPEMTAQVFFPMISKTNVLIMPIAALDYARRQHPPELGKTVNAKGKKPRLNKVFVLRDERPVEVEVVLGMSNRVSVEVISGLTDEDDVVTGPTDLGPSSRPRVMIR
ncbi:MAG: efflux RND transporter periplasmic adaptor subunit [bacterium]